VNIYLMEGVMMRKPNRIHHQLSIEELELRVAPVILSGANSVCTFTDTSGDVVLVKFTGGGTANVQWMGGGANPNPNDDIASITLAGTTGRSSLMIRDMNRGTGGDSLTGGFITGGVGESFGAIKLFASGGAITDTSIDISGNLKMLYGMGDSTNVDLTVGGNLIKQMMKGDTTGCATTVTGSASFIQIFGNADTTTLSTTGDLTKAMILGNFTESTIDVGGNSSMVMVKGNVTNQTGNLAVFDVGGDLNRLFIRGNVSNTTATSNTYGWTQTFGSTGGNGDTERGNAIAADAFGNVYVAGCFEGTVDFDPGIATDNHTSNGGADVFVTRFNSDGTYGWTRTYGDTNNDRAEGIAIDSSGNLYVIGSFYGTVDFDSGAGTDTHTSAGGRDIFLQKLNTEGTYAWTKTWGTAVGLADLGTGVAVDPSGRVLVVGRFYNTVDFDPGAGVDNHTSAGDFDVFITRFGADGSYEWTKTFAGTLEDRTPRVATDTSGNIFITSPFRGTVDFDPGAGTDNQTSAGDFDVRLTKLNSDGSYGWTKKFGGGGWDESFDVATDPTGNIYLVGGFRQPVDFDPGAGTDTHNPVVAGKWDVFLTKFNPDGSYGWTKVFGGPSDNIGRGVCTDANGNVFLTGQYAGTVDFDPGPGTDNHTEVGSTDIFLTKINANGTYGWTYTFGETRGEYGYEVCADRQGDVSFTGFFQNTIDFDPTAGTDNHTSVGGADVFVMKIKNTSAPLVDVENNIGLLQIFGDVTNTYGSTDHISAGGRLDKAMFKGTLTNTNIGANEAGLLCLFDGMTGSKIQVSGATDFLQVRNGLSDSALVLGGDVSKAYLYGGVSGTGVSITGNVGNFFCMGPIENSSSVQITGAVNLLRVSEGIQDASLLAVDGDAAMVQIYGLPSENSIEIGSRLTLGNLTKTLKVSGPLAGIIDISGSAAGSNIQIKGDLSGDLVADLFGNVMITGDFTGTGNIGDVDTAAGVGNYLMVKGLNNGTLNPDGSIFAEIR